MRLILCFLGVVCLWAFASSGEVGQYSSLSPGEILRVSGHYSVTHYSPARGASLKTNDLGLLPVKTNGLVLVPETHKFNFVALTAATEWNISATNESRRRDWVSLRYDGTNIYELGSFLGNAPPDQMNSYPAYGYVYPGPFFLPKVQDSVHIFLPWIAFHLTPQMIRQSYEQSNGVIEMPWPWANSRFSVYGYGFKWILNPDEEDPIIRRVDIVRDSALDLPTPEDELRRSNLDYPFDISERDAILNWLGMRKAVPNGFAEFSYECAGTLHTNGLTIPSETHFKENTLDYLSRPQILVTYALTVDQLEFLSNASIPATVVPLKTLAFDYRYQTNNSRTKFNFASYILDPGDQFKPANQPALLAQAQKWLRHGEGYDSYKSNRTIILVGLLAFTAIPGGLLLLYHLKSTRQRQS